MIASLIGLAKSYPIAACARCSEPWRSDLFGCPKLPLIDIGPFFRIDAAFKFGLICGEYRRILISDAKPRRDVGAKRSRSGRAAGGQLLRPAHPSFQSDKFIHCAVGYDLYRLPSSPVFVADLLGFATASLSRSNRAGGCRENGLQNARDLGLICDTWIARSSPRRFLDRPVSSINDAPHRQWGYALSGHMAWRTKPVQTGSGTAKLDTSL